MSKDEIANEVLQVWNMQKENNIPSLASSDIIVDKFSIHHGQKSKNPIENIRVVSGHNLMDLKNDIPNLPVARSPDKEKYQAQISVQQQQHLIRVYCRDQSKSAALTWALRKEWDRDDDHPLPTLVQALGNHRHAQCMVTPSFSRKYQQAVDFSIDGDIIHKSTITQSPMLSQTDTPMT